MTATPIQSPAIALRVSIEADDMPSLMDFVDRYANTLPDRDMIAAIRLDEDACRVEMDITARPVDPRRLH